MPYDVTYSLLLLLVFGTPLAGVQCSFEHKAAAGPPKSTLGGLSEAKLRDACQAPSRPHFPAFIAGSGRSSPNQRSWRQGIAGAQKCGCPAPQ